jgi:DNA repair protein RecO (recombination protein O)
MSSQISPSIIMRIREFGESDLMVTFFTPERGLLRGVAKGARRSRRRFPNCLELFCLSDMEYEPGKRGDLHFLHSCRLVQAFPGIRADFASLSLASYMAELTEILFPLGVAEKRVFQLLKDALTTLDTGTRSDVLRILFEGKVLALAGYGIDLHVCCGCGRDYEGEGRAVFNRDKGGIGCLKCEEECVLSPGLSPDSVQALQAVQRETWARVTALDMTDEMVREIKPVLKLHMEYRIGRPLKSAKYLD